MRTVPYTVLRILADLPPGQPCRVVLHTNGKGEWKAEVTLYYGPCPPEPPVPLADVFAKGLTMPS